MRHYPKHNAILTDEIVSEMRKTVRETGRMNIRHYATKYEVSHPTIHYALVGKTFKYLPDPITAEEIKKGGNGRIPIMSPEAIMEVVQLRRNNPAHYTYAVLAQRCNGLYGTHYGPSNIKRMIERVSSPIARPQDAKQRRNPNSNKGLVKKPKIVVPHGFKMVSLVSRDDRAAAAAKILAMRNKMA